MILDESLKENEFKIYRDLGNGWFEDIDTSKLLIEQLKENWNELKECIKFNRKTSLSLDNGFGVSLCDTLLNKMEELEKE